MRVASVPAGGLLARGMNYGRKRIMLDQEFDALLRDLAEQGFSITDGLLPNGLVDALYQDALRAWQAGEFSPARVGHSLQPQRVTSIRGDTIRWLDSEPQNEAQTEFLNWTEALRNELNAQFYLGLQRTEFHYAHYQPGSGYARHLDQHRGQPHRRITLILYLTPDRHPEDGGELCLYRPDAPNEELLRIAPERGRLVLFRSELLPHAVLPARRSRWSMTGWFRNDGVLLRAA